jgi:Tfp pilus assembly protein PilX
MERQGDGSRRKMRGSMLIVAMGILTLMSIMAITFARLMKLESAASTNYLNMIRAKLLAESGLERAKVSLRSVASANSYDSINDPWVFKDENGKPGAGTTWRVPTPSAGIRTR